MVVVTMEDHILVVILLPMVIPNHLIGGLSHKYALNKSINHKRNNKKKYIYYKV